MDLFSGAGGLSLALQNAGFSLIAAAENDRIAAETHAANIGGITWRGDLTDSSDFIEYLRERGISSVDLVAGGPPCQPFSRAGRAKLRSLGEVESDQRVGLWRSFFNVIDALSPRAVLFEDVLAVSKNGTLGANGYAVVKLPLRVIL